MKKEFTDQERSIITACEGNHWLADWEEYPAYDYDYGFRVANSPEELKEIFEHGNWSIRSAVIFGDLAFVQQVNGGDEWLTMKLEEDRYRVFESVSFQVVLANQGEQGFYEYLNKLQTQTVDQYWEREPVQSQQPESDTEEAPKISVLKVEVGKPPYVKEIGTDLKSCQGEVGGLIQVVYLEDSLEGAMMVVNEEGKINGMEMNRRLPGDIVCGDFFICMGDEEGEFVSLTEEKIQEYTEQFSEVPNFSDQEPDAQPKISVISFN